MSIRFEGRSRPPGVPSALPSAGGGRGGHLAAWWIVAVGLCLAVSRAQELPRGRIIDRVACEAEPSQAYALYVPSYYASDRQWPVIFGFDAGARGRIPVERLQAAAEKYGYLVAGSLNSRNGPWPDNAAAATAMITDVRARFSVDGGRIYVTGMSGGARVATAIALGGKAKGVIACGAGFPQSQSIPRAVAFHFVGIAGWEDFNYQELARLREDLVERKAVHRMIFFDGGHQWAPAEVMQEAVEWLQLQAMRAGAIPADATFVSGQLQARMARVPPGPALERWRELRSLAADFDGLADVAALRREAEQLEGSKVVREEMKAEQRLRTREDELIQRLGNTAVMNAGRRKRIAEEVQRQSEAGDPAERLMVRRAVAGYLSMTRETVRGMFDRGHHEHARGLLELAVLLRSGHAGNWYDLARARAYDGDDRGALDALRQALLSGFKDLARARAEPAFQKISDRAALQNLVGEGTVAMDEPVLQLPAMHVSAALASVELRIFHLPKVAGEIATVAFLRVETVQPNSAAAAAGVASGMEVTGIQGRTVRGLTEEQLGQLMEQKIRRELVLAVREPPFRTERMIRIPLTRNGVLPAPQKGAG